MQSEIQEEQRKGRRQQISGLYGEEYHIKLAKTLHKN
jgi:hypothetical protein